MVPSVNRGETVAREKKYARTVAIRVTAEEWQIIEFAMTADKLASPTAWMRRELEPFFSYWRKEYEEAAKREAARAKRAAKKAANGDTKSA